MSSTKNDFIYFLIIIFNYLSDIFTYYTQKIHELINLYNEENRGKWIFLYDYNPVILPLDIAKNINIDNKWIYDSNNNKLINSNSTNKIKIKWLSVELIRNINKNIEHNFTEVLNLDRFFETFELYTKQSDCPSLDFIIYCICIKFKIWFVPDDSVKLVIIDDMGNDIHIDIKNNIYDLSINSKGELALSLK